MILAVDTSLGTAVALVDNAGAVRARASSADALGHAEIIGDLLLQILAEAGRPEVTHVATGMGPGPFTGLRIGIAAARAFALGRGIPTIPVPSHFAAALDEIEREPSASAPFATVTDARRREFAVSIFDGVDSDGIPNLMRETVLVPHPALDDHLAGVRAVEVAELSASALARVAARALAAGRTLSGPEPLYLRAVDATPKRVAG